MIATLAVALVGLMAGCAPKPTTGQLDHLLYATPLPQFQGWWISEQAAAQHVAPATVLRWWRDQPTRLDARAARTRRWDVSTDLCSSSPDTGPAFDFRAACIRHDFAWRNLKRLDALWGGGIDTHARRVRATDQFLQDMRTDCVRRSPLLRAACLVVAGAYHRAVLLVS
ncbi:phospholipase A2 [Aquihabitans sp. McL0605]|uniref:phospholipase A2 n=1 Tax=Aquihabitans sp. McL0605 TaxID=3415671 RepID=UPI003CF44C2D